jgi:UDP-glucose 4-epimerase
MSGKAMVTGGAGFVGSHLTDRLVDEGYDVLVVDDLSKGKVSRLAEARRRGSVSFHQVDIRTEELSDVAAKFGPNVIFHLAAQASVSNSVKNPIHDADINVLGTLNVLEAARRCEAGNIVFTSTGGAVYGSSVQLPAKESYPKNPDSPYGISKKVVEDYFRFYRNSYDIDFNIIGPANIYGPRQDPFGEAGVVAIFSRSCLDRKPPIIFGDGNDTRDYVFVQDIVDALFKAGVQGGGRFYNIGTGVETSTNTVFETIASHTAFGGGADHQAPRPGDIPRSVLDWSLAKEHLGWEPYTTFGDGIRRTVEWFGQNPE